MRKCHVCKEEFKNLVLCNIEAEFYDYGNKVYMKSINSQVKTCTSCANIIYYAIRGLTK